MVTFALKDEELSIDNAGLLARKARKALAADDSVCLDAQGLDEPDSDEDMIAFQLFIDNFLAELLTGYTVTYLNKHVSITNNKGEEQLNAVYRLTGLFAQYVDKRTGELSDNCPDALR